MNQESINNLLHVEKVLKQELDKVINNSNKDRAYHDYYINLIKSIQHIQRCIDIASDPSKHIKLMRLSNPDEKR